MKKLILASSSQSRLDILKKLNIVPNEIIAPDVDETPLKKEKGHLLSKRLAKIKAFKVLEIVERDIVNNLRMNANDTLILSGDTVAVCRGVIMEKAVSNEDVKRYLKLSSGRSVRVYTSFCLIDIKSKKFALKTVETRLKCKCLTNKEIESYVILGDGIGKAGGFAISGFGECFIEKIIGSYSAVMGIPSLQIMNCLNSFGFYQ